MRIGAYAGSPQLLRTLTTYLTSRRGGTNDAATHLPASTASLAVPTHASSRADLLLQVLEAPLRAATRLEWSVPEAHPVAPLALLPSMTSLTRCIAATHTVLTSVRCIVIPHAHVHVHGGMLHFLQVLRLLPGLDSLSIPHADVCVLSLHALTQLRLAHLDVSHTATCGLGPTRMPNGTPLHQCLKSLHALDAPFPRVQAPVRRRNVAVGRSALTQLDSFVNIQVLNIALRDFNHIQVLVPLTQLHTLTLAHTRLCTLRTYTQAFVAVMTRVTDLTLEECDPFPRTHLLEPPHGPLHDILGHAYMLTRLSLKRLPWTFMTDGTLIPCMRVLRSRLTHLCVEGQHALTDAWLTSVTENAGSCLQELSVRYERSSFTAAAVQALLSRSPCLTMWALPYTRGVNDAVVLAYVRDGTAARACVSIDVTGCLLLQASSLCALERACISLRTFACRLTRGCIEDACGCSLGGFAARHTTAHVLERMRSRGVNVMFTKPPQRMLPMTEVACGVTEGVDEWVVCACGARVPVLDTADHSSMCAHTRVGCPLHVYGCDWTGERRHVSLHAFNNCNAWVVNCPLRCGETVARTQIPEHLRHHQRLIEGAARRRVCVGCENGCTAACTHADVSCSCVDAHIRTCAFAPRACVSCGEALPDNALVTCGAQHCVERGLRRTRMPHIRVVDIDIPAPVLRAAVAALVRTVSSVSCAAGVS